MIESYWILKAFDLYAILFQNSGPAIIYWSIADQQFWVTRNLWKLLPYIIHLFGLLAFQIVVSFYVGIHTLLHHFDTTQGTPHDSNSCPYPTEALSLIYLICAALFLSLYLNFFTKL